MLSGRVLTAYAIIPRDLHQQPTITNSSRRLKPAK
jgi:hypothetical protein